MATIVAAAGGGNWNSTASWVGGVFPVLGDDVQFTSSSGNITVNVGSACRSLDCTGYTGTLTMTNTLSIGTTTAGTSNIALKLVSGMAISGTGTFAFVSTSATQQTIDFGGKTVQTVTFAGATGNWQFSSGLTTTASMTISGGTVDFNGKTFSLGTTFTSSGSTARTLTMGAASITVGNAAGWTVSGSNLTINAGTSTVTMSNGTATFAGGGFTYYNLTFSGSITGASITGTNTFNNVSATSPASTNNTFSFGASQTINGTLTLNGNSTAGFRLLVQSSTPGTEVTLTCATTSFSYVDFADIVGAGAATWDLHAITGNSGDCGNNSGITFTSSISQTLTMTAATTWSSYAWATRVPLPQDDVTIVGSPGSPLTLTFSNARICRNLDASGLTGSTVTLSLNTHPIFGNLTLGATTTASNINLCGRGSQTFKSNGANTTNLNVTCVGGTYQLLDNCTATAAFTLASGTLDLNGNTLTVASWTNTGSLIRSINFNGGTLAVSTTTTNGGVTSSGSNYTTSGTGTISFINATANARLFAGGGFTYPVLQYTVTGSTGQLNVTGSNTFAGISFSDTTNRTLTFVAGTTTTITSASGWQVSGTAAGDMNVTGATAATWTLSIASGVVSSDWCDFVNSAAVGGASFYAGANSFDGGGNSGWVFTAPPITAHPLGLVGVGA